MKYLPEVGCQVSAVAAPHYNNGIWNIVQNIAGLRKEKAATLYHITGDVHYAVFAFPRNKTVLTIHDSGFVHQSNPFKRWFIRRIFLKWPVRYAAAVTTISEASKADIIRYTGCRPEKVVVIPNPIVSQIPVSEKGFHTQKPVILFIGSTPNKNLPRVIEALQGINCHLDVVGLIPPEQEAGLRAAAISFSAVSGISEAALVEKYRTCDLLLFPSLFEGFGLPILEAQQAGKPVITSARQPMQEVAGKGSCLVDPEDVAAIRAAVLRIIADEPYRQEIVRQGLLNLNRFAPASVSAQYLSLYQQLDKRNQPGSNSFPGKQ